LRLAASHGFSEALVCQGSSLPLRGSLSGGSSSFHFRNALKLIAVCLI